MFIMNILSLLVSFSQTWAKLFFVFTALGLFVASIFQKRMYTRWTFKSLHANGFFFLLFYFCTIGLGFFYGYDKKYVLINLFMLVPLFLFMLIPRKIDPNKIYNIILLYAFISVVFSYMEIFFWEHIGFLKHYVDASVLANQENHMLGSLFRGDSLKAFGIFSNALQNGIFIVFALIILIFKLLEKFRWSYFGLVLLFLPVVYWTYTRNVQLALFAAIALTFIVHRPYHKFVINFSWGVSILLYFGLIVGSIFYVGQLSSFDGDSIYARVFSWGIIVSEYFLSVLDSYHIFIGFALTQFTGDVSPETKYWAIDNSALMIYLSSGLIGVILYIAWMRHVVSILYKKLRFCNLLEQSNIKILIVTIFVYMVSGAMNANILNMQFLLPILLIMSAYIRLRGEKLLGGVDQ